MFSQSEFPECIFPACALSDINEADSQNINSYEVIEMLNRYENQKTSESNVLLSFDKISESTYRSAEFQ